MEKQNIRTSDTERSGNAPTSPQRQAALESVRKLNEAVERFGKQVDDGSIAPPTSAGRWK